MILKKYSLNEVILQDLSSNLFGVITYINREYPEWILKDYSEPNKFNKYINNVTQYVFYSSTLSGTVWAVDKERIVTIKLDSLWGDTDKLFDFISDNYHNFENKTLLLEAAML